MTRWGVRRLSIRGAVASAECQYGPLRVFQRQQLRLEFTGSLCAAAGRALPARAARRGQQSLVELRLFASGPFLSSNLVNALVSFGFFGSLILLPIYLQNLRGLTAFQAGLFTLPLAFAAVLAGIVGGRIVDRFGPPVVLFPGVALMCLSTWQLAQIELTTSYTWLILIFALRGLGLGCLLQTLTVAALSQVPPRQFAQASSLNTVIRFVFTALGIAMLATVVQGRAAAHLTTLAEQARPTSPAASGALGQQALNLAVQDAFWLTLVAFLLAFLVSFFIRVPRLVPPEPARAAGSSAPQGRGVSREHSDEIARLSR